MTGLTYLGLLLFSLGGMAILDYKYRLAFFKDRARTVVTVVTGVVVFTIWDIAGIALGIFFTGDSPFTTGIMLGPEFPLEELLFLTFLCYFTLVLYRFLEDTWQRT